MINYQKKGEGLIIWLLGQGVTLQQSFTDGVGTWISNASDEKVNEMIEAYNPWPFEKEKKIREINQWLDDESEKLYQYTPEAEQKSWNTQVNEAFGLLPLNLLPSLAAERGMSVSELIERVKKNHSDFYTEYGKLQGKRDNVKQVINSYADDTDYNRLHELWALSCMD